MAPGIEIVDERPGFFRPLGPAAPDGDIHRVSFGIVSYVGHGFHLTLRSNITLITRMLEFVPTRATRGNIPAAMIVAIAILSRSGGARRKLIRRADRI
jgi:hypothetical protein